ncbi:ubiquitin-specific protease UBP14 [Aspergillus lucknowensis]|uniref:Ubiquitin carboxyl-terminal hydrolase n=1 Tax=Aspergillus lucknowensis TaxID=176173 RepID=A0ABR4LP75_9EURO
MAACLHVDALDLQPPSSSQVVYREDCTQCFDSIDDESGLNVCLSCFNGGCAGSSDHARLHYERFGHPLALNIKRTQKEVQREEPPQKISKLAITAETDEDRYNLSTRLVCYSCDQETTKASNSKLQPIIVGVMNATTFSKREEIKAWEQEFIPCEHTISLVQQEPRHIKSQDLSQCSRCDLKENLWLCLECGNLGCGRTQFGGTGGNSHGLSHFDETSHAVAVKLGSITADGSADIYCYQCNEERTDPDLATHLAHWGINLAGREKTEKSLMEMQVEQNLRWDFTMTTGDGHELNSIFGPGLTGLSNLGNSCYLSSVVQCLFDLPEFQRRYYHPDERPPFSEDPAADLETQLRKLADGILSGRYSRQNKNTMTSSDSHETLHQKGLAPSMFKHLIGRDHAEFSTMRQQDAFEFLLHIFKLITLSKHPGGLDNPVESFRFCMEQRLECLNCKKVRYRLDVQDNVSIPVPAHRVGNLGDTASDGSFEPVTLFECLDAFTSGEVVDLRCTCCGSQEKFSKRSSFRTMPAQLVINARRFELINWVPTKLDIPVEVNDEPVDLTAYLSAGPTDGEEVLPEDGDSDRDFQVNSELLGQLIGMGFPEVRSEKALSLTGNADLEAAMNWLLSHVDDPSVDEPIKKKQITRDAPYHAHDPSKIAQLNDMGIDNSRAVRALAATGGDINRAIDWVFSHPDDIVETGDTQQYTSNQHGSLETTPGFDTTPATYQLRSIVCHKGSSVHAGHYVAFVRKRLPGNSGLSWVMFNDEKVVEVADVQEMKKFAYLYFFSRV